MAVLFKCLCNGLRHALVHRRRRGRTRAGAGHPLRKRTPTSADPPVPERASCAASARLFFLVHALLCSMRLEDDHPKTGKRSQRPLDAPSDLVPRKTAETCAERRYRYRMEIETTNLPNECIEPRVDVFQSRVAPPVTLGGEVDAARRSSRFGSRLPGDARRSRSGRGLRPSSSGGSRLGTATHGGVWCPAFQLPADAVANLRRHPNTSQRFDRLGLPADNELDKGLDVRLLDQIVTLGDRDLPGNWFPRFRNPVDGCDRQRSGVSRPGNAPLPPPGRPNQAGNPRHSLPFAE